VLGQNDERIASQNQTKILKNRVRIESYQTNGDLGSQG